jgi:hypothetical protein
VFAAASSLVGDEALATWQRLPADLQMTESALRNAIAKRVERAAAGDTADDAQTAFRSVVSQWNKAVDQLPNKEGRSVLVSQIVTEVHQMK